MHRRIGAALLGAALVAGPVGAAVAGPDARDITSITASAAVFASHCGTNNDHQNCLDAVSAYQAILARRGADRCVPASGAATREQQEQVLNWMIARIETFGDTALDDGMRQAMQAVWRCPG